MQAIKKSWRYAEMTRAERNNWIMNIENIASFIASEVGSETVNFVLEKYGVASIEQIETFDLSEVFSELYAIEANLRLDF